MRALTAGPVIRPPAKAVPPAARTPPPVDYAEAVRRYLASGALSAGSCRVYLISLTAWAWPLVGKRPPPGAERRNAAPPVVPLAALDDPEAGSRLAAAYADRAASTGPRTASRELSALRSAIGWWLEQRWIRTNPTAGLRHAARQPTALPPLTADQVASLFRAAPGLREHAFWRVLYDSGAPAADVLGLDVSRLDLSRHRARLRSAPGASDEPGGYRWIYWREGSSCSAGCWPGGREGRCFSPAAVLAPGRTPQTYARSPGEPGCPTAGPPRSSPP